MEFLEFTQAWNILSSEEVVTLTGEQPAQVQALQLDYHEDRPAHRILFGMTPGGSSDIEDVEILDIPREKSAEVLEHILHKLHISPLLLFPIGKWRNLFEVVSPNLLENPTWMELDTSATIELNTRDPLHFDFRELHTLTAAINAILLHAETLEQGCSIATTSAPVLVEVDPTSGILITLGNPSLSAEIRSVALHVAEGNE